MGNLVSTVNGGTSTSTVYIHPDILGSTNVITNASGQFLEALNYRPFGSTNLDLGTTGNESRGYIGQEYDASTAYNYLNARYYNSANGRFVSEDPIFVQSPNNQNLPNPQDLNSYGYADNNPIRYKDPSGRDHEDYNISGMYPFEEVPIGPSFSIYHNDGTDDFSDPLEFVGLSATYKAGLSGSVTAGPGNVSEGINISVFGFGPKTLAAGGSFGCTINFQPSCGPEAGFGIKGVGVQIGIIAPHSQIEDFITGGPLEYQTTPMTASNIASPKQSTQFQISINPAKSNANNNSYTVNNSYSYSNASYYLSEASSAIKSGNYADAINYLSSASNSLK
jgi:RHS repeat-associated protein